MGWDSNPRYGFTPYNGLASRRLQPLGHPSSGRPAIAWVRGGVNEGTRLRAARAPHGRAAIAGRMSLGSQADARLAAAVPARGNVRSARRHRSRLRFDGGLLPINLRREHADDGTFDRYGGFGASVRSCSGRFRGYGVRHLTPDGTNSRRGWDLEHATARATTKSLSFEPGTLRDSIVRLPAIRA